MVPPTVLTPAVVVLADKALTSRVERNLTITRASPAGVPLRLGRGAGWISVTVAPSGPTVQASAMAVSTVRHPLLPLALGADGEVAGGVGAVVGVCRGMGGVLVDMSALSVGL